MWPANSAPDVAIEAIADLASFDAATLRAAALH
jgi:hypothetical protein